MGEATERLRRILGKEMPVISHAHYGDGLAIGRPPENTMPAFRQAIAEGADVIETDVQVTSDGEFVLIHDGEVDRTTDSTGRLDRMTLVAVKKLSAFYGRKEFSSERIMTLGELVKILPASIALLLEVKSDRFLEKEIARRFVAELDRLGISERTALVSFSLDRILAIRSIDPAIPIGRITHKPWKLDHIRPQKGVEMLGPAWYLLVFNPFYVRVAHQHGQMVCPLDSQPERRLWYYKLLGVDAVISNDLARTLRAIGRTARAQV